MSLKEYMGREQPCGFLHRRLGREKSRNELSRAAGSYGLALCFLWLSILGVNWHQPPALDEKTLDLPWLGSYIFNNNVHNNNNHIKLRDSPVEARLIALQRKKGNIFIHKNFLLKQMPNANSQVQYQNIHWHKQDIQTHSWYKSYRKINKNMRYRHFNRNTKEMQKYESSLPKFPQVWWLPWDL